MGRDATLSWPKPDIIFKNDTEAGAVIHTEYTDKSITVKIFGDNGGRKVKFQVSAQQDITKPPIEYIPDMTQPPEKRQDQGSRSDWLDGVRHARHRISRRYEEAREAQGRLQTARASRDRAPAARFRKGEPGYTGEKCPEPEADEDGGRGSAVERQ